MKHSAIDPHRLDEPGYIIAWHSKREHKAGKFMDKPMSYGDARKAAARMEHEHPENTYWAEQEQHLPPPH